MKYKKIKIKSTVYGRQKTDTELNIGMGV